MKKPVTIHLLHYLSQAIITKKEAKTYQRSLPRCHRCIPNQSYLKHNSRRESLEIFTSHKIITIPDGSRENAALNSAKEPPKNSTGETCYAVSATPSLLDSRNPNACKKQTPRAPCPIVNACC